MRRIITLELVGLNELGCDLYNEKGEIICKKGTKLTPDIQMKLSHAKVYKRDEESLDAKQPKKIPREQPIVTEPEKKTRVPFPTKFNSKEAYVETIKRSEPINNEYDSEFKPVIDSKKKNILLQGVKEILYSGIKNAPVNNKLCYGITQAILGEVYTKLQKVENINQLRLHDQYTFTHSINVAIISALIGKNLKFSDNKVKDLTFCAFLHDLGKFKIPGNILYKPGSLTSDEMQIAREHSQKGYDYIINSLGLPEEIAIPALQHHERWDGFGYPAGLKGDQISEFSQIVAIADVYDALISEKVYRGSVNSVEAMRIMLTEESRSFNPEILEKFVYMSAVKKESFV